MGLGCRAVDKERSHTGQELCPLTKVNSSQSPSLSAAGRNMGNNHRSKPWPGHRGEGFWLRDIQVCLLSQEKNVDPGEE